MTAVAPNTRLKDPQSILNYGHDWANFGDNNGGAKDPGWLQGDTISASSWTIAGDDSSLTEDSSSFADTIASIVLSGGTAGVTYTLVNTVVTAAGWTVQRTLYIQVVER